MSDKTKAIRARIAALLARTTDRGCTEAEAAAAALHAAKLMDEYGFAMADLDEKEPIIGETWTATGAKRIGAVQNVAGAIGAYCDVKVWMTRVAHGVKGIRYFGRTSDVQVAQYLTDLIAGSIEFEWKAYARGRKFDGHGAHHRASFQAGMTSRLYKRLMEMKAARNTAVDPTSGKTGNALVIVKGAEVAEAFAALNMKLRTTSRRGRVINGGSYSAGTSAADRVSINPGVGGGSVRRIGGGAAQKSMF